MARSWYQSRSNSYCDNFTAVSKGARSRPLAGTNFDDVHRPAVAQFDDSTDEVAVDEKFEPARFAVVIEFGNCALPTGGLLPTGSR